MKKYFLSICILLSFLQIKAQTIFNRAYHESSEIAIPFLTEIHGDLYFVSWNREATNFGKCNLYRHSNTGILKSKTNGLGFNNFKVAIKTLDEKMVFFGSTWVCAHNFPTQVNILSKIDTNGTALFTATFAVNDNDNAKAIIQYSDSTYFSFTDSLLFKHDKTGQFLLKKNLGLTEISSALELSNGNILISARLNGNISLVQISSNGTIQNSKPFPGLMNKLTFYGGQKIMGRGFALDKSYYKISPALEMISHFTFSTMDLEDFEIKNDTVYSILSSQPVWSSYRITDTLFNTISLTSTSTNSITQNAILLSNNKVNILSWGKTAIQDATTGYGPHFFVSFSQLNKFSSNNFTHDLKVLTIEADSMFTSCYPNTTQPGSNICNTYLRSKVKIKNMGTTLINNFKLNCWEYPSMDCGHFYYQELFSNLNLLPGDSISVTTNSFVRHVGIATTSSSISSYYCFFTSLPNGETDKTIEDNAACKTFNFLVTSLKENSKLEQFISIAPNPFNTELMIEADSKISQISIYNALGQVIKTQEASDKKIILNNVDLQNGIYFLHIETEKGMVIKKVLKD